MSCSVIRISPSVPSSRASVLGRADPEVISIKMTLHRMARESQIVQALIEAAENGKEVVAPWWSCALA